MHRIIGGHKGHGRKLLGRGSILKLVTPNNLGNDTYDLSIDVLEAQLVDDVTVGGKVLPPHVHEHPPPPIKHELLNRRG